MSSPWTDLAAPQSWALIGAAWLALNGLRGRRARALAFALIHLSLITLLLGFVGLALVAAGLGAIYGVSRLYEAQREGAASEVKRALTSVAALGLLVGLFIAHKLGAPHAEAGALQRIGGATLEAVGFSYLFLRAVDLLQQLREGLAPPPKPLDVINYLIPFNMLTAGPIQRYSEYVEGVAAEAPIEDTTARLKRWIGGGERIASGMVKKFIIAGAIHSIFLADFATEGWGFFVEMNAFYLWLYFDFSAYSDIAVGIGQLCGVRTPENFNHPLSARNLTVFWERWHISLSLWVRGHLYIPAQLRLARATQNRRPVLISTVAFTVAFTLCGLWHDVSVRFLLWGLLHAAGLSACNAYRHGLVKRYKRKGVRDGYMKVRWIRYASTALTFEFVAASLAFAFYPGFNG